MFFCSYFDSGKGAQLAANPNIGITAWWDHVGYQVRIVGVASKITDAEAIGYWKSRTRDAQLATISFEQSKTLDSEADLAQRVLQAEKQYAGLEIPKPNSWGGYLVVPHAIEFLAFRESRLHLRECFTFDTGVWSMRLLQP